MARVSVRSMRVFGCRVAEKDALNRTSNRFLGQRCCSEAKHLLERMAERGISDKFALEAMRQGLTKGDVDAGQNPGEWKVKMTYRPKGRREVGVVVVTVRNERLLVKTVEWEDLK